MSQRLIQVLSTVDLKGPVQLIEIELRHGAERWDAVLDPDHRTHQVSFTPAADGTRAIQYRYRVYVHPGVAGAEQRFETPLETTDASVLVADPFRLVRVERVTAFAVFSHQQYATAFVDVRVATTGQPIQFTLEVRKEQPQMARDIAVPAGAALDIQSRIRYVTHQGEIVERPWQASDSAVIVVANPAAEVVTA